MPASAPKAGKHGESPGLPTRSRASNNDSPTPTKSGVDGSRSHQSAEMNGRPISPLAKDVVVRAGSPKSANSVKSPRSGGHVRSPISSSTGGSGSPSSPSPSISSPRSSGRDVDKPRPSIESKKSVVPNKDNDGKKLIGKVQELPSTVNQHLRSSGKTGDSDNTSTTSDIEPFSLRANFVLPLNLQCSALYSSKVSLVELIGRIMAEKCDYGFLEQFLEKLRVETHYLEDEGGKKRTQLLRIKGLGHMREPSLEQDGSQKVQNGKLVWEGKAEAKVGDADSLRFECDKEMVSVRAYFKQKRGLELNFPQWILDCGKSNKPNWIPAELATIVPGQTYRGTLNDSERAEMIELAHQSLGTSSKGTVKKTGIFRALEVISEAGTKLGRFATTSILDTIPVPGRVLQRPQLQYGGKEQKQNSGQEIPSNGSIIEPSDIGTWNLEKKAVFKSADTKLNWAILGIGALPTSCLQTQSKPIVQALCSYKLNLGQPEVGTLETSAKDKTFTEKLKDRFADLAAKKIRLILVVLQPSDKTMRDMRNVKDNQLKLRKEEHLRVEKLSALKAEEARIVRKAEQDLVETYKTVKCQGDSAGIHTLCVHSLHFIGFEKIYKGGYEFAKGEARFYANLALKMNLMTGGINHRLHDSVVLPPRDESVMFIGIDINHPANTGKKEPFSNLVGVVANVDLQFSQWAGEMHYQVSQDEIVQKLDKMVEARLDLFNAKNGQYPQQVVVYRAGVSDGQYDKVMTSEVPAVENACGRTRKSKARSNTTAGIAVTVIIVSQNHQKRLHSLNPMKPSEKPSAPLVKPGEKPLDLPLKPGTVFRRPNQTDVRWDFFLQSHGTIEGTATPAQYIVIKDQNAHTAQRADHLEQTTYNLCHLGRSTVSLPVCAPVYYAALLCKRALCHVDRNGKNDLAPGKLEVNEKLRNSMFYI